jgi:hypothetical protein
MKLFEIGSLLGREHADDHERFRTHWEEHVLNSRRMILQGAARVADPDSVTVLGGAATYNIPTEELAQRFRHVRLVDIDGDGLRKSVDALDPEHRGKVEICVADTTGGVAARLLGRGLEIIDNAGTAEAALDSLVPLFNGQELDLTPAADIVENWKASYIVSSGLSSQLTLFPEKGVLRALHAKFGTELDDDYFFKNGSFRFRNESVRRHGELLASLVLPNGRIYWADTVAETPYLSEFGAAPLALVLEAVAAYLERAYLKTLLTEAGKGVLAERFAEGRAEGKSAPIVSGEDLLLAYNAKLRPEQKRRVAWAIMTLVGENHISPKREVELVKFIIREAERMMPQARQPLIEGGNLESFVPDSLEHDVEMASWLWINDPEGAVTLDGYSYYVEALLLGCRRGL